MQRTYRRINKSSYVCEIHNTTTKDDLEHLLIYIKEIEKN